MQIHMADNNKKNVSDNADNGKVMTKYDKKMQARREQEAKDARNSKIFKGSCIAICVLIIAGVAGFFGWRYTDAHGTYVKVGDYNVNKIEYDFYYNSSVNNFVSTYSQYLSYFGLDTTKDFAEQQYTDGKTWDDYFAESAIGMLKQSKALCDDAKANNWEYDVNSDYNTYIDSMKTSAESASQSLNSYIKKTFGTYASEGSIKEYVKEYLTATAYYDKLLADNEPTDSEIKTYYEEHKNDYDNVDYRMYSIVSGSDDESDPDAAVAEARAKANTFAAAATSEDAFKNLCVQYSSDEDKSTYTEKDASLITGASYSSLDADSKTWLYDTNRVAGDVTVIEDDEEGIYSIFYFVKRYYDSTNDDTIKESIESSAVSEYIDKLTENYSVDGLNHITYLKNSTTEESSSAESSSASESTTAN